MPNCNAICIACAHPLFGALRVAEEFGGKDLCDKDLEACTSWHNWWRMERFVYYLGGVVEPPTRGEGC